MTLLRRSEIAPPVLPAETIEVPSLGGEVIVQGIMLSQRIALYAAVDAQGYGLIPNLLARTVMDADRQPVFSAEQWDAHGATHAADVMMLFNVARRLSGMDGETEKNA